MRKHNLIIPTKRDGLFLRELDYRDDEAFHKSILASREHLATFGRWALKFESLSRVAYERTWQDEYNMRFGIWDGNDFCGNINARHDGRGWAEIGSIWMDAGHAGQGIATFAFHAVQEYLVSIGARQIFADAKPENVAAVKLLERAGFVLDPNPGPSWVSRDEYIPYVYNVPASIEES